VILVNKGTFIRPGGGAKERSLSKVHDHPGVKAQYIHDMLASQKGEKESRAVTEAEEETMFNQIWNQDYRDRR
jgi:hypothetical protein